MENTLILKESKYINTSRELTVFTYVCAAYLSILYVLPQYFGIPFPIFHLTVFRIMIIILLFYILGIRHRQQDFIRLVVKAPFNKALVPYFGVLMYTAVYRIDINAFLNPASELLGFYLLIYVIKYGLGYKKVLNYIIKFSYIITSLGLVEYVLRRSPFSFLETIHGLTSGIFIRSGYYRIMGPSIHSLGYGLILITMVPIICYDIEKKEINILKHKLLFLFVTINVLLTGSRSTLSVFLLELFLLALLSTRTNKKKLILIGSLLLTLIIAFLILFRNTAFAQYIMLQLTSIVDELFGTGYSIKYGADIDALGSSSNYRSQLKYIFQIDWLNPFIGIGRNRSFSSEINGSFVRSVDNFYIADYVRYAYPGMICYIAFLLYFLIPMLYNGIKKKSQISKMLFIGSLCYCINLLWLDSLQTLKYIYVLFAIYCSIPELGAAKTVMRNHENRKLPSKYIKSYL